MDVSGEFLIAKLDSKMLDHTNYSNAINLLIIVELVMNWSIRLPNLGLDPPKSDQKRQVPSASN